MSSGIDLRWSALAILATGLLSAEPLVVVAQTSSSVVCLSSFNWMDNSKNQNPCVVAAYLGGVCDGGQYTISPLPVNTHYTGPLADESNPCQCSSVTYNMMSACGLCQNRTIVGWSFWSTNCSTVYSGVFTPGVPAGAAVPQWAFQDVTSSDLFNVTLAQTIGDNPESTASNPQSTVTAVTSTIASGSLTTTPSTSSTSSSASPSSNKSDAGAVAGGVIGGVVGLALIAAVVIFFMMKKKRSQTPPSAQFNNTPSPGYPSTSGTNTNPNLFATEMTQPRLYDPSDPSTFPSIPAPNTITTVSSQNIPGSNLKHPNPSVRPGGYYSSVPEI